MSHVKTDKLSARTASGTITLGESGETFALGSGATVDSGFTPAAISINASASSGALAIDASDNLQFNSGYGSTATAYGCRAWVNFNGTGTVAIRESRNVSSITDGGVGRYTVNFLTSLPDNVYSVVSDTSAWIANSSNLTTSSTSVDVFNGSGTFVDSSQVMSAIFR